MKTALRLFAFLGVSGTLLMCLIAPFMSALQGDEGLFSCYLALAPAVFLVALIAVLRGYFQGKYDMVPTAVSEIVEQIFKTGIGLFLAYHFRADPVKAVSSTLLAVTLSEAAALFYLYFCYRGEKKAPTLCKSRTTGSEIFRAALPVMAAAALLPLSQMADSIVIVRLLARHSDRAVALYGLFAGSAAALINLPATASYGLAAASVPAVSRAFAKRKYEEGRTRALYALGLTVLLCLPCAVGLFVLARPVTGLLFPSLSAADKSTLIKLVRLMSVSAVLIASVDTLSACLTGMGRAKWAALSMLVAVVTKLILQLLLVGKPSFSIGGAAIAANACYLVAFFLDLIYTVKKDKRQKSYDYSIGTRRSGGRSHRKGACGAEGSGRSARSHERIEVG